MLLQSVRDLKLELAETILASSLSAASDPFNRGRASRSKSASFGNDLPRPLSAAALALGVAPDGNEFKLAIRVQREHIQHSALVRRIVAQARGEVDVRVTGRIAKRAAVPGTAAMAPAGQAWHRNDLDPMLIGASVGHYSITAGSIGAFVEDAHGSYILSNNHILANENNCTQGDVVLQRASSDGGRVGPQSRAILQRWIALTPGFNNTADAAIASCDRNMIDPTLLRGIHNGDDKHLAGVAAAAFVPVYKIGRTTGPGAGYISAFELDDVSVDYTMGTLLFDDVIEISSPPGQDFSEGGDSGALVVNQHMQGVGLLFAGNNAGTTHAASVSYAHPLIDVLQALRVRLIT